MVTRNVKDLNVVLVLKIFMHCQHSRINTASPATAAGNDKRKFIRVKAQKSQTFLTTDRHNILSHGITCKYELIFLLKSFRRFFIAQSNLIDYLCQDRIGNSGNDILFLNHRRYARQGCRHQNGTANKTARTDDHMRLETTNNAFRLKQAGRRFSRSHQIAHRKSTFQAAHVKSDEVVALFGNKRIFQSRLGSDIKNLCRLLFFNGFGYGNGRINMAPRPASGYNDTAHETVSSSSGYRIYKDLTIFLKSSPRSSK